MVQWPKRRAWGWYATLIRTPWFCLKLLRFKAGGELSLQRHFNRTEIWFFIKGDGRIYHNESDTHNWLHSFPWIIKPCDWHKFLAYDKPVYAIELQYGRKVTESDIERLN